VITIGADPGLTGALAFLDHRGGLTAIEDLPTCAIETAGPKAKVKRKLDARALRDILRRLVPADEKALFVLEDMQLLGGSSVQTMGALAHTRGILEAVAILCDLRMAYVTPRRWKRFYGLDSDKRACLDMARTLFPDAPLKLAKHHNRAEALLIARYALRTLT
jgi:hypothetical protein